MIPVSMYRLTTFGKLELTGASAAALSHQRRRLALLALLAAAGESGLSRDQILGYLWPDSSSANGRHSLEQLLHGIRRSLGEGVFTGTNPVALSAAAISSDVAEFERALSDGAFADAVSLVEGPFLQGFYLDDAPEFERWTSTERARLANRYSDALQRLAADAERAGDYTGAVRWRRRLVEEDPLGSRSALALMRALVASGDTTAALQHARVYETIVKEELDTGPDPSIVEYAAALRAGVIEERVHPSAKSTAFNTIVNVPPERAPAHPAASAVETATSAAETPQIQTVDRRRWWIAGGAIVGMLLAISVWARLGRDRSPVLASNRIVIVPFRVTGADSSVKYLREGVVDLMVPMLTGEGGPAAVDSRTAISTWNRLTQGRAGTADDARRVAREVGAAHALMGAIVESRGRLTITGTVISAAGNDKALTSIEGSADSVALLLNAFAGQLLARQANEAETSLSAITNQSLPAIRAYLDGRAAYRNADESKAMESYGRALDIDSTFALAALELAVATGKLLRTEICRNDTCRVFSVIPGFVSTEHEDDLFDRAVRLAWDNRMKLGPRDRPLLDALRGDNYPRESSARETLANLGRAVRAAPDRPETQYLLGTLLLYQGVALGLSDSRGQAESAFRTASRLDTTYMAPLARMVEVAAFDRDTAKLRRAGMTYLARSGSGPTADYIRWLVAAGTADSGVQREIRNRFRSLGRTTLDRIYYASQMTGFGIEDADSAAALMIRDATDPLERSVALRRGQLLAWNRGRPSEGTRLLHQMDELRVSRYNARNFAISAALFTDGERAAAVSAARELSISLARDTLKNLATDAVRRTSAAMSIESLWYVANGDTARAAAASRWLRAHAEGQQRNRVLLVLPEMLIASRARRPEGAPLRAQVDSISRAGCCELPDFVSLVLAQAYESSGDEARALSVIRRGLWTEPPRNLSTFLREEGRLSARAGDREAAIRAYEHYLALRTDPEPVLRPEKDRIGAEVAKLKQAR